MMATNFAEAFLKTTDAHDANAFHYVTDRMKADKTRLLALYTNSAVVRWHVNYLAYRGQLHYKYIHEDNEILQELAELLINNGYIVTYHKEENGSTYIIKEQDGSSEN